jgi:hypothetical protein
MKTIGVMLCVVGASMTPMGCKPSPADVQPLVDNRLVELGLLQRPDDGGRDAELTDALAVAPAAQTTDPVADSLRFLAKLDTLMADYVPNVALAVDNTDVLRCVTTRQLDRDAKLKAAGQKLVSKRKAAAQDREKRLRELYGVAFRIDYDWRTKRRDILAVMGCWFDNFADDSAWVDDTYCDGSNGNLVRRVRSPADLGKFVYSQSTDAPSTQPELMARIDAAHLQVPARFHCRVEDVSTERMTTLVPPKGARPPTPRTSSRRRTSRSSTARPSA